MDGNLLLKLLLLFLFLFHHLSPKLSAISDPILPSDALPTKSGYLTVNSATGSAMFYTFYEAQEPNSSLSQTPLLIWLQGGPGCSSMIGNFYELGPWRVSSHKENVKQVSLDPNPGAWNRLFGVIFIDNPIGVGFSIAGTPEEIPRDQQGVARHLFTAIKSFIASDDSLKSRPLYITGESYAGKYIPAIGSYILKRNALLPLSSRVNLAGVAIGNGLTHPVAQVATHAEQAFYVGLINEKQKIQLEKIQSEAVEFVQSENWSEAINSRRKLLNSLEKMTGLSTLYDYRRRTPYETPLVTQLLNIAEVQRALGVNESTVYERCSDAVAAALNDDVMKSVKDLVEFLVKKTRVLLYQGSCDMRDGVASTEAWVKELKWDGIRRFLAAEREVWKVKGVLAGYVQKWRSLSNVVVLEAGHLLPADQPVNSQAMIEDWILERGLFNNGDKVENWSDL